MLLVSKWDTGADKRSYQLALNNTGGTYEYRMTVETGTGDFNNYVRAYATMAGAPPTDGTWVVIRGSMDLSARTGKVFVDKVDETDGVNDVGAGTSINNEDAPFLVGSVMNSGTPGNFFDGTIDVVVLAATYTATHSESLREEPCCDYLSNMRALYLFNGSSYADLIAGNDLTGVNAPTFVDGYPFDQLCSTPTPTP